MEEKLLEHKKLTPFSSATCLITAKGTKQKKSAHREHLALSGAEPQLEPSSTTHPISEQS